MIKSPSLNTETTKPPNTTAFLLLFTIVDTTWRAFVPTIGGTVVGILFDNLLHTAPLITFITIPFGFIVSGILITLQVKKVARG